MDEGAKIVLKVVDEREIEKINNLSQLEMARLWRFAPPGHIYFDTSLPYFKIFEKRYAELGGFTPVISKSLDW